MKLKDTSLNPTRGFNVRHISFRISCQRNACQYLRDRMTEIYLRRWEKLTHIDLHTSDVITHVAAVSCALERRDALFLKEGP